MLHLLFFLCITIFVDALVAEQVDAADLKSVGRKAVPVRFRPSAPFIKKHLFQGAFFVTHSAGIKIPLALKRLFPSH